MNPMDILQLKSALDTLKENHPKFLQFLQVVSAKGIKEGTIIEITVQTPEGENYHSNLRITDSDLELIQNIKNMKKN